MIFVPLSLPGAYRIDLEPRQDARGFFARLFCEEEFAARGLTTRWVQMNTSLSHQKGTIRGLHFQRPPGAEVKVVRCVSGAVFDVIVDLREGSETYGRWEGLELSAQNRSMIYVPEGFAHGFQTLSTDCEMLYLHSCAYDARNEGGLRYDDPTVAINWPLAATDQSPRDAELPLIAQCEPIRL